MNTLVITNHQDMHLPRWKVWLMVVLAATLIASVYSARNIVADISINRPIQWSWEVNFEFIYWYVWAAFTPLILWFAARLDPEHISRLRLAGMLVAFGAVVAPVQSIVEWSLALSIQFFRQVPSDELARETQQARRGVVLGIFGNSIIYVLIVAGHYGYDYYRKFRERQLRSAELEGRLAQAELQNLKMQLQPHFLFNTLNTISVLMMRDTSAANRMLVRLSDLLRLSLDHGGAQEVSLKQELEFLDGYLEIEQTRFQDRLTIKRNIDRSTLDATVPNLILQPLVENAIRHGIAKKTGAGMVEIRSKRIEMNLYVEIQDNGPGLSQNGGSQSRGLGLRNTRERLHQLYGSDHSFDLSDAPGGGVLVNIVIPFRTYEQRD